MDHLMMRLHESRDAAVNRRKQIVDEAKREHRDGDRLSAEEDREFRALTEQIREFDERIGELSQEEERAQAVAAARRAVASGGGPASESRQVGAAGHLEFLGNEIREAFETVQRRQPARIESRAVTSYPVQTVYGDAMGRRREPTRVLNLLPVQRLDYGDSATYWASSAGADAAAPVAVGAQKPESTPGWTPVSAPVRKVAHWTEAPNEAFDDFASFDNLIRQEMVAGVIAAENQQILSGTGTAPQLTGLLNTTGVLVYAPGTAEPRAISLLKAMTTLRTGTSFAEADRILMHPSDYELVRRWQSTSNELIVGDVTSAGPPALWGVPVTLTTGLTAGTALVGDLAGSTVAFQREAPQVFIDPYSQSTRNMTRVIAETRLALGVIRPTGLVRITFNGTV